MAHPKRIMVVVCLAVLMIVMDTTVLNVAIPVLGEHLTQSEQSLQWIIDSYLLVFASLILMCGSLGDRFGRRKMLFAGLVVFGAASAGATFAQTANQLIAMRVLMGLGGAMVFPTTLSIIAHTYTEPARRAKAVAVWTAMYGLAVIFGPLIGGVLLTYFWWGAIFLLNIPIVIVVMLLGAFWLPKTEERLHTRLDFFGTVLSVLASGAIVATIIEAPSQGWTSPVILGGFAAGAVLALMFVLWEIHSDHPMLHMSFFRLRAFSSGSFTVVVAFFSLMGICFVGIQYLQFIKAYSPAMAGVSILPLAFGVVLISQPAIMLAHRFGPKLVIGPGLLLLGAGAWVLATVTATSPYWVIGVSLLLIGVGLGLVQTPVTDLILLSIPKEHTGVGSAMNDMTREIGAALGVAVAGSVMSSFYRSHVTTSLTAANIPHATVRASAESLMGANIVERLARAQGGAQSAQYIHDVANKAFMSGFTKALFAVIIVIAVGFVITLFAVPNKMPEDNQTQPEVARDVPAPYDEIEAVLDAMYHDDESDEELEPESTCVLVDPTADVQVEDDDLAPTADGGPESTCVLVGSDGEPVADESDAGEDSDDEQEAVVN